VSMSVKSCGREAAIEPGRTRERDNAARAPSRACAEFLATGSSCSTRFNAEVGQGAVTVIERLTNPDAGVRHRVCAILKDIGGRATLKAMQSIFADPDLGVRVAAKDLMSSIALRVGPPSPSERKRKGGRSIESLHSGAIFTPPIRERSSPAGQAWPVPHRPRSNRLRHVPWPGSDAESRPPGRQHADGQDR
jgi:hypothetical protein